MIKEQELQSVLSLSPVTQELARATRIAAIASAPWIGKKNKNAADQAAVDGFQSILGNSEVFSCEVIIGEGTKDKAPMLYHGSILGKNLFNRYDLAVDPVEGTTFLANGEPGSVAVAALTRPGGMLSWSGIPYMNKIVVGPKASNLLDYDGPVKIDGNPEDNIRYIAESLGKKVTEMSIAVLNRQRNSAILEAVERLGAYLVLLAGGDVLPALNTSLMPDSVDMLYGSGGSPEAVLTAAGITCLGGNMQAMWHPQNDLEIQRAVNLKQSEKILYLGDLIGRGEIHFALTAITEYGDQLIGTTMDEDGIYIPGTTIALPK